MIRRFVVLLCLLCSTSYALPMITPITWDLLKDYEFETETMSDQLSNLMGQTVEIAGFIVPLEMDEYIDRVRVFFLVPDPLACIHVPPPPPNQMIYVHMNESIPVDMDFRGVLIRGKISIASSTIDNQMVGFELAGISATEADIEYESPFDFLFEEQDQ